MNDLVEMFASFIYGDELTYEELLATEKELMVQVDTVMKSHGGSFLQFAAMGDMLRAQCLFPNVDEHVFQSICDALVSLLNQSLKCKVLFVDKELQTLHLYYLNDNGYKESVQLLP